MRIAFFLIAFIALSAAADTTTSRIASAVEAGVLSPADAVRLYVQSVVDRSLLPGYLTDGTEIEPCGTPAMDAATALWTAVPVESRGDMTDYLARPVLSGSELTWDTPGGHFKIHYTTSGEDATDIAYVQLIGGGMDSSWAHIVDTMDWDAPPSDLGLGGDNKYDVYIMALDPGTLGYCSSGGEPPDPSTPEADTASHIAMSNNQSYGSEQMLETCSHEFLHAVENGYEAGEPSWFKENCSVWVQNECWTTNRYADYLHTGDNCLRKPWYDIRTGAMYHYGAAPWPMYMEVRCGGQQVVREVWENCAATVGANMLAAITETAESHGMSFNQWLAEYTCWRWFTGTLADDQHYEIEESSLWTPGAYVFPYHVENTLPATGDAGTYPPETFGHHWIKVDVSDYQGWITFEFDGRDGIDWIVGVIRTSSSGADQFVYTVVTDTPAQLTQGVSTTGWDYVIFFVQPITDTSLTLTYTYSITTQTGIEGQGGEGDVPAVSTSANPVTPGSSLQVFLPEGGFTTVNVFDLAGRLVQTPVCGQMDAGSHVVSWDTSGLASGAYFVRLTAPGGGATERVILAD